MGLIPNNKENDWKFIDFVKYIKRENIKGIEFPIDFFAKKERQNFEFFFEILKKNKVYAVVDLEDLSLKYIKQLVMLSGNYDFKFIRIKMSNLFGGNRYLQNNFNSKKKRFEEKLKKCSKIISNTKLKILIENHQDLSSIEIIKIIKKCKYKNVGINWDVGNSLPTCETPSDFFNNAKKYIYNVHCKDYKVILSSEGYYMKRTTLGNGVINFKLFVKFFKDNNINISVELGAHISRHSHLFKNNFSKYHNVSKKKLDKFKSFIMKNSVNENPLTIWELHKNINKSSRQEDLQFQRSLIYLKNL